MLNPRLQNKTEEEIEKLNNVGLLARKNRFLEFRTEVKDILDSIMSICEEKDEETYCTEKDDILDTLEAILVAMDTQLMPSVVNSNFEVKNQGSGQSLVSARSAEGETSLLTPPHFGSHSTSVRATGDDEKRRIFYANGVSNDPDVLATIPEELKAGFQTHDQRYQPSRLRNSFGFRMLTSSPLPP
ncbi:DUF1758 domain-containing protein [Trichonephila inaurata madagascariensis]|uniref:DUF1758 domain-containing protein n=1 Tax=Trichonephila inaurata madagascariensis TaxID=2747483 RepID=A0A8X6WU31_9ARAC|nr:DUF1758 domain-containing protein [Trichonephila inaurata madagascariensis]